MLDNLTVRNTFLAAALPPTLCLVALAVLGFTVAGSITIGVIAIIAALCTVAIAFHLGNYAGRRVGELTNRLHEVGHDQEGSDEEAGTGVVPKIDDPADEGSGRLAETGGDLAALDRAVDGLLGRIDGRQRAERQAGLARIQGLLAAAATEATDLVDRQLDEIDELEASEDDGDRLAHLFRLDHLTARLHRCIARLAVVGGRDSFDARTTPAPAADVVRVAIGQNPHYERIEVHTLDEVLIAPTAALELTQLLSELLANSTASSTEQAAIEIYAAHLDDGSYRVTIIDRGTGLDPAELDRLGAAVSAPSDLDDLPDHRIGLNVVGRLARHLGATVDLSATAESGVTVDVRVPAELVIAPDADADAEAVGDGDGDADADAPSDTGPAEEWTPPALPPRDADGGAPATPDDPATDIRPDRRRADRRRAAAAMSDDWTPPAPPARSDDWTPPAPPVRSEQWTPPEPPTRLDEQDAERTERRKPVPAAADPTAVATDKGAATLTRRTRAKSVRPTQPAGPPAKPSGRSPKEARSLITSYQKARREGRRSASTDQS